MAVFNYPILMTADIIAYDIDIVPVWKDQTQHLEFSRDIAGNFNKTYNCKLFKLPSAHIEEELKLIPGTDGRKMSKSYDNFIWIFDSEKVLKKKIMSIITWSESLEESKNPDNCNIFALIKLFATKEKQKEISDKYKAGNYWYGNAKLELLSIILEYFKDARKKYDNFDNDMSYIELKLEEWNKEANMIVDKKYKEMMEIIWL
jgi:tryptophanyl-tRNA synthetase